MKTPELTRRYDDREIFIDAVVHGVGLVCAFAGVAMLVIHIFLNGSQIEMAGSSIYGAGLLASLAISLAYNVWPIGPTKWFLRRLDHSAIFVLIAATYTPFLISGLSHPLIFANLIGIWGVAAFGITLKCVFPGRYDGLSIALYLVMGWSGVLVSGPVTLYLQPLTINLIFIGGVIYSLGVIFHMWEKLRFQKAIWHGFVVTAAGVHFAAVVAHLTIIKTP